VRNLVNLAAGVGLAEDLLAALNGPVLVACVGPVCAAAARAEGITDVAVPEHWRLGALVRLVADELGRRTTEASAVSGR
jgi:uroporphyrinogen-III synthase